MKRYNVWRPIFLLAIALLTKSLVTNLGMLFGMAPEAADNLGFLAMIIAAFVMYFRMTKMRRK
ncbi:hypothetical protein JCM10914A_22780 [Paenibacillus sp. JCM 10914]|uniref:hypothetical protein n=1 Tax=Paenibacillus sp. JCM 10914 TaxID=1236974 RepID=UPI0003CC43FE|nr:hypothetical protein [Paenibacillus sp. JCM 10914]GAE05931.1 hypothetical protein JCM10914_2063 [Paenibacillus sp. JCM 10914]